MKHFLSSTFLNTEKKILNRTSQVSICSNMTFPENHSGTFFLEWDDSDKAARLLCDRVINGTKKIIGFMKHQNISKKKKRLPKKDHKEP